LKNLYRQRMKHLIFSLLGIPLLCMLAVWSLTSSTNAAAKQTGSPTRQVNTAVLASSGRWSKTGSMSTTRVGYTATLLMNGKVLVAGGENKSFTVLASTELYDPNTGTWSPTGSMNTTRDLLTATLLPNGKVLIVGGDDSSGPLGSAELYNPGTGAWSPTGSMSIARDSHIATLLTNGKVLVAGGFGIVHVLASAELYTP